MVYLSPSGLLSGIPKYMLKSFSGVCILKGNCLSLSSTLPSLWIFSPPVYVFPGSRGFDGMNTRVSSSAHSVLPLIAGLNSKSPEVSCLSAPAANSGVNRISMTEAAGMIPDV